MSSTYVHYHEPSSLPTDYALVNHFRHINNNNDDAFDENADEGYDNFNGRVGSPRMAARRVRSFNSTGSPHPEMLKRDTSYPGTTDPHFPDESTPLLAPVPRIDEHDGQSVEGETPSFWKEFRILFKYTMPVLCSHLLEYTLVSASVVSIGHLGTNELAASTLGSMTAGVTAFSIVQGLSAALDTVLPSAWTSAHPSLVGLWSQRMCVIMFAVLFPIIAIWLNAEAVLLVLKQEPEVAFLAGQYLRYLALGLPAYCFNAIARRYFQSQGLFTIPTRLIVAAVPINAFLNWLLVWGPDPIRLGFIGAPIATSISFNLISIALIVAGIIVHRRAKKDPSKKIAWHPIGRRTFTSLGVIVHLGIGGVGQVASEWWSWELIGLAASQLGPVALATQSILLVSASTTYQAPFALSVASAVRIGNLLGEGDAVRAKLANNATLLITMIFSAFSSTLYLSLRNVFAYIFNDDPEVVKLVSKILPLVALFQIFDGLAGSTSGIMRARGKQFLGAVLNLSAYYIIGIPLGIYLAFSVHLGLAGLWLGLTFSLVYCGLGGVIICVRTDWRREVLKVEDRLRREGKLMAANQENDSAIGTINVAAT